jgi:hypothetical protein
MPSLYQRSGHNADIFACMHRPTERGRYVDLGRQFAEKHESKRGRNGVSSHVYTSSSSEVCCSLNMFHLMEAKGNAMHCFDYTISIYIDDVFSREMTASAYDIQRCSHIVVTPLQHLPQRQGVYEIKIKERQIRPIYHGEEEMTSSIFRIEYLYFLHPPYQMTEMQPLYGRAYNYIPALSWKLWERQEARDFEEKGTLSNRMIQLDQKAVATLADRPKESMNLNSDRRANQVFRESKKTTTPITPPRAALKTRIEAPAIARLEDDVAHIELEEDSNSTSLASQVLRSPLLIRADTVYLPSRDKTPDPVITKMEKEDADQEDEGSASGISTPSLLGPPPTRPACLDAETTTLTPLEQVEKVKVARSPLVNASQRENLEADQQERDGVKEQVDVEASNGDAALEAEDGNVDMSTSEVTSAYKPLCDIQKIDNGDTAKIPSSAPDDSTTCQMNEKKRSAPSEDYIKRQKKKLQEARDEHLRQLAKNLDDEIENEIMGFEVAKLKEIENQKRRVEYQNYLQRKHSKELTVSDTSPKDPRRALRDTVDSQKIVELDDDGDTSARKRQNSYQGEIPFSPMSMQSPIVGHDGSPPHCPGTTAKGASVMSAPNLPKPKMQNHEQRHR